MISTQINQAINNFDEIVYEDSNDFVLSGLKKASVIRISRLSIVTEGILFGNTGEIANERLHRIKLKIAKWISGKYIMRCYSRLLLFALLQILLSFKLINL